MRNSFRRLLTEIPFSVSAHERSIHTDIAMGLLKKILKKRPELRVIVSSATLDAEYLRDFFNMRDHLQPTSSILSIEGRTFPVEMFYMKVGMLLI